MTAAASAAGFGARPRPVARPAVAVAAAVDAAAPETALPCCFGAGAGAPAGHGVPSQGRRAPPRGQSRAQSPRRRTRALPVRWGRPQGRPPTVTTVEGQGAGGAHTPLRTVEGRRPCHRHRLPVRKAGGSRPPRPPPRSPQTLGPPRLASRPPKPHRAPPPSDRGKYAGKYAPLGAPLHPAAHA